ncbi:MAG: methyltransferase domain-containing protein, partial [Actinobacteria bacterium]|nr:methyltransferase domain-containing protein [Actinomycetota bacterium]
SPFSRLQMHRTFARALAAAFLALIPSIAAAQLDPQHITGIDIADQMLEVGRKKIADLNLSTKITLHTGDSESIKFTEGEFDAVTCAYGVRNFENLEVGLREMFRVLRPGGKVVILEFSQPTTFPVKQFYSFYLQNGYSA